MEAIGIGLGLLWCGVSSMVWCGRALDPTQVSKEPGNEGYTPFIKRALDSCIFFGALAGFSLFCFCALYGFSVLFAPRVVDLYTALEIFVPFGLIGGIVILHLLGKIQLLIGENNRRIAMGNLPVATIHQDEDIRRGETERQDQERGRKTLVENVPQVKSRDMATVTARRGQADGQASVRTAYLPPSVPLCPATGGQKALGWIVFAIACFFAFIFFAVQLYVAALH